MFGFMVLFLIINIYQRKEGDRLLLFLLNVLISLSLCFFQENKEFEEEEDE